MLTIPQKLIQFAVAAQREGGRAICVGGSVRDSLLGQAVADWDMEVYGLTVPAFEGFLRQFGTPQLVGGAFGVYRLVSMNLDVSLPRQDNLIGVGHRGFHVIVDPHLAFADALKRRDLTINSMGYDPLTGELIDPYGGMADLHHKILRPTHLESFGEDPLRGMRAAQFLARLDMEAHPDLVAVCRGLDMNTLSPERVFKEFEKMLLQGAQPSRGLMFLEQTTLLRFFPALVMLTKMPQDLSLSCEGDPWVRTLQAVDEAALWRQGDRQQDLALMFGALCHAFCHLKQVQKFMRTLRASALLEKRVCGLVKWHCFPIRLQQQGAGSAAYRRLARALDAHALSLRDLSRLTWVTESDRNALREWEAKAQAYDVFGGPPQDAVTGKFLIAQGVMAGRAMGDIIQLCREIQDEHPSWCAAEIFAAARNREEVLF